MIRPQRGPSMGESGRGGYPYDGNRETRASGPWNAPSGMLAARPPAALPVKEQIAHVEMLPMSEDLSL